MLYFVVFFPVVAALLVPLMKSKRAKGPWAVIATGVTLCAMLCTWLRLADV